MARINLIDIKNVNRFKDSMIKILCSARNEHKTHWDFCSEHNLFEKLNQETKELKEALDKGDLKNIKHECCDIANFAFMIYEKIRKEELLYDKSTI